MKRLFPSILGVLLLSCTAQPLPPDEHASVTLTVGVPGEAAVKTSLEAKDAGVYPVFWSEGDVILVNGVASAPLAASEAGGSSASFSLPKGVTSPYNILYSGFKGNDDLVSIPFRQEIATSGTFAPGAAPMWASTSGAATTLNHLAAIIRIPVNGSGTVAHVKLSSLGGEMLAGELCLAKSEGLLNGSSSPACRQSQVYLVPQGGTVLSGSDYVFVAAVAPGTFSKGIDAEIVTTDGRSMHLGAFVGETLSAGTVYEFPSATFAGGGAPDWLISSESSFAAWRAALDAEDEVARYGRVLLTADIVIRSGSWSTPFNIYNGTLDGGGHRISGLSCPLFNVLHGSVMNLSVESSITAIPANSCAGLIAQRMNSSGNYTPSISNCTASGKMNLSANTSAERACAGGIIGSLENGSVKGCYSAIKLTLAGVSGKEKILCAGGIAGRVTDAADALQDCIFTGSVVTAGVSTATNVGGIAGESAISIVSSLNLGTVN